MNRLATAHAQYVAALKEERAEIDRLLAVLDSAVPKAEEPPAPVKPTKAKPRRGRSGPGSVLLPSTDPPKKYPACGDCGRDDVAGKQGGVNRKVFHYAKACGLPCAGSSAAELKRTEPGDLAGGVHSLKGCKNPKCARVKYR